MAAAIISVKVFTVTEIFFTMSLIVFSSLPENFFYPIRQFVIKNIL